MKLQTNAGEKSLPPPREKEKMTCPSHARRSEIEPTFPKETLKTQKNVKSHPVRMMPTFCQVSLSPLAHTGFHANESHRETNLLQVVISPSFFFHQNFEILRAMI